MSCQAEKCSICTCFHPQLHARLPTREWDTQRRSRSLRFYPNEGIPSIVSLKSGRSFPLLPYTFSQARPDFFFSPPKPKFCILLRLRLPIIAEGCDEVVSAGISIPMSRRMRKVTRSSGAFFSMQAIRWTCIAGKFTLAACLLPYSSILWCCTVGYRTSWYLVEWLVRAMFRKGVYQTCCYTLYTFWGVSLIFMDGTRG